MDGPSRTTPHPEASLDALRRDGVHLWWGQAGDVESLDASRAWLSDEERRRSERFHRERDARAFVFRRAFLRATLARYVGGRPEALAFATGPFGKPALLAPRAELDFNASSREGTVLLGLTAGPPIGVDLELCPSPWAADPEEIARLAARVATPAERARLLARAPDARAHAFLELWTRKEALLKALGTGLAREPASVEVGWRAEEGDARVFGPGLAPCWLAVQAPEGFLASVVVGAHSGEARAVEPTVRVGS
jgi:4'-phosphopantetheinyl transferase